MPKTFVDTNILIYAHDQADPQKNLNAQKWLLDLWTTQSGVLSIQVLQESYVTLTGKLKPSLTPTQAQNLLTPYLQWEIVSPTATDFMAAIAIQTKYKLSYWDSAIVQAAISSECSVLLSEDMQHGQRFGNLKVVNPFSGD